MTSVTAFDPTGLYAGDPEPDHEWDVALIRDRRGEAPFALPSRYDIDATPVWCISCGVHKAASMSHPCPVCFGVVS